MSALFKDREAAPALAQAIVDMVRELLLVLDTELKVRAASRSFCAAFGLTSKDKWGDRSLT